MQTRLPEDFLSTPAGQQADRILRNCVHCGFCSATCPTYQLLGDELDSPRGRIYLIKQMLEGQAVSRHTQVHLDRCLTCRACETTCPSGVEYGKLVDTGREWIERKIRRPLAERIMRRLLRAIVPRPARLRLLLRLANLGKVLLPARLQHKIPAIGTSGPWPSQTYPRKMLAVDICAQSTVHPQIDAASARVLARFQIELLRVPQAACCGAISQHLAASKQAYQQMKRNIDAWWPLLQQGAEGIVVTASGCGAHIKEYQHFFAHDPEYRDKARLISSKTLDISELLSQLPLQQALVNSQREAVAFHSPCTLQHGQQIINKVEPLLQACGYQLHTPRDAHLCCGSAGTYSVLQAHLSAQLLDNKLRHLCEAQPDCIATANIGCLMHLQTRSPLPVVHWIELVERALDG